MEDNTNIRLELQNFRNFCKIGNYQAVYNILDKFECFEKKYKSSIGPCRNTFKNDVYNIILDICKYRKHEIIELLITDNRCKYEAFGFDSINPTERIFSTVLEYEMFDLFDKLRPKFKYDRYNSGPLLNVLNTFDNEFINKIEKYYNKISWEDVFLYAAINNELHLMDYIQYEKNYIVENPNELLREVSETWFDGEICGHVINWKGIINHIHYKFELDDEMKKMIKY
jgi:hypothetical protein